MGLCARTLENGVPSLVMVNTTGPHAILTFLIVRPLHEEGLRIFAHVLDPPGDDPGSPAPAPPTLTLYARKDRAPTAAVFDAVGVTASSSLLFGNSSQVAMVSRTAPGMNNDAAWVVGVHLVRAPGRATSVHAVVVTAVWGDSLCTPVSALPRGSLGACQGLLHITDAFVWPVPGASPLTPAEAGIAAWGAGCDSQTQEVACSALVPGCLRPWGREMRLCESTCTKWQATCQAQAPQVLPRDRAFTCDDLLDQDCVEFPLEARGKGWNPATIVAITLSVLAAAIFVGAAFTSWCAKPKVLPL